MLKIGFIGAGNMAKAMMQGWAGNADIHQVVYSPNSGAQVAAELGLEAKQSALDVWAESDMVVLAMPPAQLEAVAKDLQLGIMMKPSVIVASVLGGVSLANLHAAFGEHVMVARTLPNVNVALKYGYTALAFDADMDQDVKGAIAALFLELGRTDELPEEHFGAVSALAGSGPAFVAAFAEAMTQAGIQAGIAPDTAARLAEQTVVGTARHMGDLKKDPMTLAHEVMTPGGSTAAGWEALEQGNLNGLVADAIQATMKKNAEFE